MTVLDYDQRWCFKCSELNRVENFESCMNTDHSSLEF